jgi:hypothetical protein
MKQTRAEVEALTEQLKHRESQLVEVATREETLTKDINSKLFWSMIGSHAALNQADADYEEKLSEVRKELEETKQALSNAENVSGARAQQSRLQTQSLVRHL